MLNLAYLLSNIKKPASLLLMDLVSAQVLPMPEACRSLDARNQNVHSSTGVPPSERTIFTLFSLFCTTVLSLLLGKSLFTLD